MWGGMWGGGRGEKGSLVKLPVHRPSLCTSLAGLKYVCAGSMVVFALQWSSLCNSL